MKHPTVKLSIMVDDIELAYLAGFMDGEGWITQQKGSSTNASTYRLLQVGIGQNTREVLDWIKQIYGGNVYTRLPKHRSPNIGYQWQITGEPAAEMLRDVIPFLRIKKSKAEELLLAWETRHDYNYETDPINQPENIR